MKTGIELFFKAPGPALRTIAVRRTTSAKLSRGFRIASGAAHRIPVRPTTGTLRVGEGDRSLFIVHPDPRQDCPGIVRPVLVRDAMWARQEPRP